MKPVLSDGTGKPRWQTFLRILAETVLFAGTGAILAIALLMPYPSESPIRQYLVEHAGEQTGALNLVTSIYLGFRAFDTLGETIVLLLAVSGVLLFAAREQ